MIICCQWIYIVLPFRGSFSFLPYHASQSLFSLEDSYRLLNFLRNVGWASNLSQVIYLIMTSTSIKQNFQPGKARVVGTILVTFQEKAPKCQWNKLKPQKGLINTHRRSANHKGVHLLYTAWYYLVVHSQYLAWWLKYNRQYVFRLSKLINSLNWNRLFYMCHKEPTSTKTWNILILSLVSSSKITLSQHSLLTSVIYPTS